MLAALVLNGLSVGAEPPSARAAFDAARGAFAASNYAAAASSFAEAAAAAPAARLDPAAAHFNAGLSAYAARQWEAAAAHFARAASGSDLGLQAKAYYNRGNALFHQADQPLAAMGDLTPPAPALESASGAIGQAIQMYENAIALAPDDVDAKANYELAILKQQELQQMQQEQQEQQDQEPEEADEEEPPDSPPPDDEQPAEASPPDDEPDAEPEPQPEDERTDEMTPEEAEMLLDALREQEQSDRDRLQPFLGQPVPVEKDW